MHFITGCPTNYSTEAGGEWRFGEGERKCEIRDCFNINLRSTRSRKRGVGKVTGVEHPIDDNWKRFVA